MPTLAERTRAQLQEGGIRMAAAPATMRPLGVAPPAHHAYLEDAPEEAEDAKEEPDRMRSGNPSPSYRAAREDDGDDVVDLTSDGSEATLRAPRPRAAASVARGVSVTPSAAPVSEYLLPDIRVAMLLTYA